LESLSRRPANYHTTPVSRKSRRPVPVITRNGGTAGFAPNTA
jgi:hypothetical protein